MTAAQTQHSRIINKISQPLTSKMGEPRVSKIRKHRSYTVNFPYNSLIRKVSFPVPKLGSTGGPPGMNPFASFQSRVLFPLFYPKKHSQTPNKPSTDTLCASSCSSPSFVSPTKMSTSIGWLVIFMVSTVSFPSPLTHLLDPFLKCKLTTGPNPQMQRPMPYFNASNPSALEPGSSSSLVLSQQARPYLPTLVASQQARPYLPTLVQWQQTCTL